MISVLFEFFAFDLCHKTGNTVRNFVNKNVISIKLRFMSIYGSNISNTSNTSNTSNVFSHLFHYSQ